MILPIVVALLNSLILATFPPLPSESTPQLPGSILPPLLVLIITLVTLKKLNGKWQPSLVSLWLLTLVSRLSLVLLMKLQNLPAIDNDLRLFFGYGQEFALGGYPAMEYPQGALLWFALPIKLGLNFAGFRLLMILANLAGDLVIIKCFFTLATLRQNVSLAKIAGLWWALFPFGLIFNFSKYDSLVAAFLVLGVTLFLEAKNWLAGLTLGLGFTLKWLPGLAVPALALLLLKERRFRNLAGFLLGLLLPVAALVLPFYFYQPLTFKHTYYFHQLRVTNGESIYYPLIFLLQPGLRLTAIQAPWTDVAGSVFGRTVTSLGQLILVALTSSLVWFLSKAGQRPKAAILGLAATTLFILFNRAFSPQFFVITAASLLSMGILAPLPTAGFFRLAIILLGSSFLGYLVWPLFYVFWLPASALFFLTQLYLLGIGLIQLKTAQPAT